MPEAGTTRWIAGLAEVATAYDAFAIDQFGVLHDGRAPYPGAVSALRGLKAAGKRVIVVSNSGKRADYNAQRLARFGATPDLYDDVLSSGELTWRRLRDRDRAPWDALGTRVFSVDPMNDREMLAGLPVALVARLEDADFVLLASLPEDRTAATMTPLLHAARERDLPLVCANPDVHRFTAAGVQPASGFHAQAYAALGGRVVWVGKPHAAIYEACRERFATWGATRLCAIGDSLQHDVAGGAAAGWDTGFVAGGLLAAEFAHGDRAATLARLLASADAPVPAPTWALHTLSWNRPNATP